jgi:hypothetical protein
MWQFHSKAATSRLLLQVNRILKPLLPRMQPPHHIIGIALHRSAAPAEAAPCFAPCNSFEEAHESEPRVRNLQRRQLQQPAPALARADDSAHYPAPAAHKGRVADKHLSREVQ